MKEPRYTDLYRYGNGYRRAVDTDIAKTFERARAEHKQRAEQKVQQLRRRQR